LRISVTGPTCSGCTGRLGQSQLLHGFVVERCARLLLQLLDAMVEEMVRWEFHMRDLGARGAAVKAARGRRTPHELRTGSIDEGLASEGWGKWVRIEVVP
jgi:hypothetical protein